jgi:hypothetical protein
MADKPIIGDDGAVVSKNIQKVEREMTSALNRVLDTVEKRLDKIGQKFAETVSGAVNDSAGGKVGGAGTKFAGGIFQPTSSAMGKGAAAEGAADIVGGVGGMLGKTKMMGNLSATAMNRINMGVTAVNMGIDAANSRFESGREGVLEADRMSVLYQQMTGKSQLGVSSTYRMPLTNYRLGAGGINALMGLEAATGISGRQQASSVEAFRTMSGYNMSAGQATGMINDLASAPTVNRMFMMGGTSLIGVGGKQNSAMDVMQGIVKSAGLTDPAILKGALAPGSITRSKLSMMGVPEEMQTQAIQYAMQNQTFKGKGGQGMYDPSKEADRRKMGIEENFATQVEETQRLETKRDENFYRRQVDNYAHLERQTQSLTKMFGALEDKLSGVLGLVGSNKIATSIFQSATGPFGDPDGANGPATPSTPMPKNVSAAAAKTSFNNLNGQFKERLTRMLSDNPNVTFGEGVRSSDAQRAMFLSRYTKTDSPTNAKGEKNWEWDGSYWEHKRGFAAAPPGRSMHEIGLAADLGGDLDWVVANAHKYGLKHFKDVNNEAHHVQPTELPNGRSAYEKMGAPWGRGPAGAAPFDSNSDFGESLDHSTSGKSLSSGTSSATYSSPFSTPNSYSMRAKTIAEKVAEKLNPIGVVGAGGGSGQKGRVRGRGARGASTTPTKRGGQLSGEDVARYAYNAGFRGENLVNVVGIAKRESNWNAGAYNPNASTSDLSFGLMQINMLGDLGPARLKQFGLSKNEELYDPATNMRAAFKMSGGTNLHAWGGYKGKDNTYNTDLTLARQVVANAGFETTGDPDGVSMSRGGNARHVPELARQASGITMSGSSGGGSNVSLSGGHTFNINPTINVSGGGSGSQIDLQKIAHEIAVLTRRELELEILRSN